MVNALGQVTLEPLCLQATLQEIFDLHRQHAIQGSETEVRTLRWLESVKFWPCDIQGGSRGAYKQVYPIRRRATEVHNQHRAGDNIDDWREASEPLTAVQIFAVLSWKERLLVTVTGRFPGAPAGRRAESLGNQTAS